MPFEVLIVWLFPRWGGPGCEPGPPLRWGTGERASGRVVLPSVSTVFIEEVLEYLDLQLAMGSDASNCGTLFDRPRTLLGRKSEGFGRTTLLKIERPMLTPNNVQRHHLLPSRYSTVYCRPMWCFSFSLLPTRSAISSPCLSSLPQESLGLNQFVGPAPRLSSTKRGGVDRQASFR